MRTDFENSQVNVRMNRDSQLGRTFTHQGKYSYKEISFSWAIVIRQN